MRKTSKILIGLFITALWSTETLAGTYLPPDSILNHYISIALKSNITLTRKTLSYRQSLAALREVKRSFLPTLSFNATYSTAEGQNPLGINTGETIGSFTQNLDLINSTLAQLAPSYPSIPPYSTDESTALNQLLNQNQQTFLRLAVPIFNAAVIRNQALQKELIEVSQLDSEDYKDELVKEVKLAYFQWLQAGEQVNVYQNALQLAEENVRTNRSLFQNAKVTKDVYLSAQARRAEVIQQLTKARKDQVLAQAFFNFLLNRSYNTVIIREEPSDALNPPTQPIDTYQAIALENRKDLKQVRQFQEVKQAQMHLQKSNYLPQASLALDAGYRGTEYVFNNENDFVALSAQLKWDIYTFGKNEAKVQQAKIDQQVARTEEQALLQNITIEVVKAYLEIEAAYEGYQFALQEVTVSTQELRLVKRKYELGQVNRLTLEDVETDYQNAQLRVLASKYNILKQKAQLERVTSSYVYEDED